MVLAEELVGALGKRLEADHARTTARDDFLHLERLAFELLCARVQILDGKLDRLSRSLKDPPNICSLALQKN